MGRVGQRRSLSLHSCFRSKLTQAVEKTPGKAPGLEIALRFPLYTLPLRRLLIRFPTKVCLGQYKDGGTVKRLAGSLWYKTVLGNRDFYEDRQARNSSWLGAWLHSEAEYICADHFHHPQLSPCSHAADHTFVPARLLV